MAQLFKQIDECSVEDKWRVLEYVTAALRPASGEMKAAKKTAKKAAKAESGDEASVEKPKREISGGQKAWLEFVAKIRQIVYDEIKPEKKDQKPILAIAGKMREDGITEVTKDEVLRLYEQYTTAPWQSKTQKNSTKKAAESDTESVASIDTKDREIYRYLFSLQKSGTTNMLGSGRFLQDRFGFSSAEAEKHVLNYIENYEALKRKYE